LCNFIKLTLNFIQNLYTMCVCLYIHFSNYVCCAKSINYLYINNTILALSSNHSLVKALRQINFESMITYSLENIRRKGTTKPYPNCFFILPTIFKPRKNNALAKNADPNTDKNPSIIAGTFWCKTKLAITPIKVMKTIGFVITPLIVAIAMCFFLTWWSLLWCLLNSNKIKPIGLRITKDIGARRYM